MNRMRVDIFPSLNVPKIYVFLDYVGMSPDQMEGFIVNQLELYFQYVDGIEDIKTRGTSSRSRLCELSFFPGTDMGQAMAQVVAMSDRAMSWMPKGTLPPMIMRMDAGSVPVGYLVFESDRNLAGRDGRPGAEHHPAAGAEERPRHGRHLAVRAEYAVDRRERRSSEAARLQPQPRSDVIEALAKGNTIIPAGNVYIKDSMPIVSNNATVVDIQQLGDIPIKIGSKTSISATLRRSRTTPTSPTGTPWSTARSPSTCRSSRRTPARR